MNQHQLARNSQVQAARQRLAMRGVPGGAQAGNLAGCGPDVNQGYWPVYPNDPQRGWYPVPTMETIPAMAPPIPPNLVATPETVLKQQIAPLSIIMQVAEVGAPCVIEVTPRGGKMFYASGISSCNECFQIILNSFDVGGSEYNLISGDGVDVGVWNTDDCYCPWDIGCISTFSPATISFSAFGTPSVLPFLNLALWGESQSTYRACWPPGPWNWYPPTWGGGGYGGYPVPGNGGNGGNGGGGGAAGMGGFQAMPGGPQPVP